MTMARQWDPRGYANFTGIDWLYDTLKDQARLRRLRNIQGWKGRLLNALDRSAGWVLVTLVAVITAGIAWLIVITEIWLSDIKDGYCSSDPWQAKRWCGQHFVLWAERFPHVAWIGPGVYSSLALFFAISAAALTVYFTASTRTISSKDIVRSMAPSRSSSPPTSPLHTRTRSRQPTTTSVYSSVRSDKPFLNAPAVKRGVMYFGAGAGIPEIKTILGGFVIRGFLGGQTLVMKSSGLLLSVSSGLSLGKEGPFVHIASCVANILCRFFPKFDRNEAKRREIISAACAAGVAVAFGAPIGGVLFSLEEVSRHFPSKTMIRSFYCALLAAMTLKGLNPFRNGKIVLFEVTFDRDTVTFELVAFLLLGTFGGIYGALFCKANMLWSRHVRSGTCMRTHSIIEVAIVTCFTALISYSNRWLRMAALGLKALLTVITFGLRIPAGIFIPTLAVGAFAGRACGLAIECVYALQPEAAVFDQCRARHGSEQPFGQACVIPGLWAMIGAAAALAGVTRMTISLAVIMFELTGSLTYVLPVMLSVLVAKAIADAIEPRSIYDLTIEMSELPFLDNKTEYLHSGVELGDIVNYDAPTISASEANTLGSIQRLLETTECSAVAAGFPILIEDGDGLRVKGYINLTELASGLELQSHRDTTCPVTFASSVDEAEGPIWRTPGACDLGHLSNQAPMTLSIKSSMALVHELFVKLGLLYILVVDEAGLYLGAVERNRWLSYLQWCEEAQRNDPTRPKVAPWP